MNGLMIAGTSIRRDAQGRYSLNDLHKAAGGEKRHGPSYWLDTEQASSLIAAMSDTGNPVSVQRGGVEQGTYVAEQLVVAYASWIRADFHLEVINTFLAAKKSMRRQDVGIAGEVAREFRALTTISKLAGLKGNQALIAAAQGTERLTGTNPLALIGQTHLLSEEQVRYLTPTDLGKVFGESAQAFNRRLEKAGFQSKDIHGNWVPTDAGKAHAVLSDTGKRHGNGTPIQQLRWLVSLLDVMQETESA